MVAEGEGAQRNQRDPPESGVSELELRVKVPVEVRNVSFPVAVRGYSRPPVDAYVKRVNHLIAELEVSRSPRSAVQHALDRVSEEVSGVLQRARETADEITSSARREAEAAVARASSEAAQILVNANDEADRTRAEAEHVLVRANADAEETLAGARAKSEETLSRARAEADKALARARAEAEDVLTRSRAEADEKMRRSEKELSVLRDLAEARMRDLQADTDAVREERGELLDDIHGLAERLEGAVREAKNRIPVREPEDGAEETSAGVPDGELEPGVASAPEAPTVVLPGAHSAVVREDAEEEPPSP